MGMGWGMCYCAMERENKRSMAYGDGYGVVHVLPFHRKRTQGLYGDGDGVGHLLQLHRRRTQRLEDMFWDIGMGRLKNRKKPKHAICR